MIVCVAGPPWLQKAKPSGPEPPAMVAGAERVCAEFGTQATVTGVVTGEPSTRIPDTPLGFEAIVIPTVGCPRRTRTRRLAVSATYTLAPVSTASACGLPSVALTAGPPSPVRSSAPVPAIVVTAPPAVD